MRNIQSYFFIIAIFVVIFANNMVFAEDGKQVRNSIQGVWVAPDCRNGEEIKYISKNFIISYDIIRKKYDIDAFALLNSTSNYGVIKIDNIHIPVRVLEDGVLQLVDIEKIKTKFPGNWDDLPVIRYHEYMHCFDTDLPKLLPELIDISVKLDNLYKKCRHSISNSCKETLFANYMAENGNFLDKNSIISILSDMNLIAKARNNIVLSHSDIKHIAGDILKLFDKNNSKAIEIKELNKTKAFWNDSGINDKTKLKLILLTDTIGDLFPAIPIRKK